MKACKRPDPEAKAVVGPPKACLPPWPLGACFCSLLACTGISGTGTLPQAQLSPFPSSCTPTESAAQLPASNEPDGHGPGPLPALGTAGGHTELSGGSCPPCCVPVWGTMAGHAAGFTTAP